MPDAYLHLSLMVAVAVAFAVAFGVLSRLVGPRKPLPEKTTTYETGVGVPGVFLGRFNVKFFIVAVLFLVFDLEVVFLYPGAVVLREQGLRGFVEIAVFLCVLAVGWAYVVRSGVLDWGTPRPGRGKGRR